MEKTDLLKLSNKVKEALKALENSNPKSPDRQTFNEFLIKLVTGVHHEEGKALYDETVSHITNRDIKTILHEIYLERNWDIEY